MGRYLISRAFECVDEDDEPERWGCGETTHHNLTGEEEGRPVYRCHHCDRRVEADPNESMAN